MEISNTVNISAARQNLRQLSFIRNIALGGQLLALFYFSRIEDIGLPIVTISAVLLLYALVIAATWWRSHLQPAIIEIEFFSHLLVDILFFTALLFYSGGASNPFVSYYLVPISIAAITLSLRYTCAIAGLSLLAYSWLLNHYLPIPALLPSHHQGGDSNLHILGMWCNFAVSAGLITYFVTRMAKTLKQQEEQLAKQREDQLRDEQLLGIGTLAAGTAHELGTPLNTMKILVDEMAAENGGSKTDISILQQQIEQCRTTLKQLVATAESSTDGSTPLPIKAYFDKVLERWQVMRPEVQAEITYAHNLEASNVCFHPTIAQSLTNLLNNAADVSPERVDISLSWDKQAAELIIKDYGPGIAPQLKENLGKAFASSKPDGMGLGLFLTQATINRYGGQVSITPGEDCGTITRVTLPLDFISHS